MLGAFFALLKDNAEKKRFNELYNRYSSMVFNYAYHILEDVHLSEDTVNEAFFSLARNMNRIKDKTDTDARNYLIVIAKNRAYRILRGRNHIVFMEDVEDESFDSDDVELEICARDLQNRLLRTLKNMDEKYGDVMLLKYYFQLTNAEIATELGITLENVKVRLHRARKTLRKELEGMYDG